jgi:hypothetical protein
MLLFLLVLSARTFIPGLPSATPSVIALGRVDQMGLVEVCNGAPVSPSHAVTLYSFASGTMPFVITDDGRLLPDSTILFRDLGLAMLVFDGEPFSRWNDPRLEAPLSGEAVFIAGYRSDGITFLQTRTTNTRNDGSVVLSMGPAPGLMGAAAYDASGRLLGIITGTIPDQTGNDRLALLPSQLWSVWSSSLVNGVSGSGSPFGVSALAYTLGEMDDETPSGVLIVDVCEGSRAENCGLRSGDIVTEAGGNRVYHPESLRGMVNSGETVELSVYRAGMTVSLAVPAD